MKNKNREKQLVKNTAIVAVGQICTKFISFFLLPLYTAVLSTKEYGTVELLNTYISLLLPLIFLQMDQAIFRFLIDVRKDEEGKKKIISTTLTTVTLQAFLYIILYLVFGNFIHNEYKYFLATNVIAAIYSSILLQISRGLGDNATYSMGSLVSGAGTIILNVLFIVVFKLGAYGMLVATLIANILCATFIFIKKKIYKYLKIRSFDKNELRKLWKYSIPLVPNQLSWWIINASDRTIVTYFLGIAINGIYSASNKFSSIIITFFNIFNITWAESASLHFNDKDNSEYFSSIMNTTLKLFISLCLMVIAIMPFAFRFLITGADYASAYYQIPILMISTIFNICVSLLGSIYVALKKSKEIAKTSIYAAIINIVVNLALIKFIGLYAASISTLVSYLAMSIYRYIDVQKYVKIKLDKKMIIISIITSIIFITIYYLRNTILCLIGAVTSLILVFLLNKNILYSLFDTLKKKLIRNNKYS